MAEENGEDSSVMRIGKRCYVGNLAWKTSWQDLKDKFRDVGNVVYANVMRDDGGECCSHAFSHTAIQMKCGPRYTSSTSHNIVPSRRQIKGMGDCRV